DDGGEAFAHVVAGDLGVLVLEELVGLGELVDGAGEGAAEAGEMGAAVGVVDGVGVAEDLVLVGVVVLEDDLAVDLGGFVVEHERRLFDDADGVGVDGVLAGVDLADELGDAVLVEEHLGLGGGGAFVDEVDFEAGVEEGEFAQALGDAVGDEDGGFLEDLGVGLEGDVGAGAAGLADDFELFDGLAALELHVMDVAAAGDLDLEPFGDGVDALGADAVGAAGEFVSTLSILAAGVQGGEHHLDARDAVLGVDVHGDAATVVADGDGAVHVDGDVDAFAVAGEVFVHGVVEDFGDAVVQGAFVGASDIHAGLFAHGFEAFEFPEFGGVVVGGVGGFGQGGDRVGLVGHVGGGMVGNLKVKLHPGSTGWTTVFCAWGGVFLGRSDVGFLFIKILI